MRYRPLGNTGLSVSALSYGASSLGGVFRNIDEAEGIRTVHEALDLGINLLDVSPLYGLTKAEKVLGKALETVSRYRYILSTKAGRYGQSDFDFSADRIIRSVEESLIRLKVDYIDILHLHDIEHGDLNRIIEESIPTLYKLKEQGKIRFCGISGLPLSIYNIVLDRLSVDVILTYCHYSLNDTSLIDLLPYLEEKKVGVINASPLSMGLLSIKGTPLWHPASTDIKVVCLQAAEYCRSQGQDISKLAVQFAVSNPDIPTTLVGTASSINIRKNVQCIEEPLDLELIQRVQEILMPILNKTWQSGRLENN
ncbi:aldo/keto reductase [Paenibacillus psychroresistens]|uniref:Aldo/keto reductase n=1 Tax=Paenibacillus psychroresistens TaxID=1778678 RepID=A0A6B8RDV5_9BACL|nr:aldo/keto reductase [Paenibacillus psychroresistens]QGQ94340.1 aldo/keto reductase [Paenibacillus psychroresistens]